jgi:hypothetical protein
MIGARIELERFMPDYGVSGRFVEAFVALQRKHTYHHNRA